MLGRISYFHAPSIPSIVDLREPIDKDVGGIISRTTYINYTFQPIYVMQRSGLAFTVENKPNRLTNHFLIRTEYTIPSLAFNELIVLLSKEINKLEHPDLFAMKELFFLSYESITSQHCGMKIAVDTIVTHEELKKKDILYIYNHDILLSITPYNQEICHPFNSYDMLRIRYNEIIKPTGTNFTVEIVDNENILGDRYFYAADRLFKVMPFRDNTRVSGVYFIVNDYTLKEPNVETIFYDISEAEKSLGLYKTKESALTCGDTKLARQEEVARLVHESSLNKIEITQLQQTHAFEIEKIKAKAIEKDNERKLELLEFEAAMKRHETENRLIEAAHLREKQAMEKEAQILKHAYDQRKLYTEDYFDQRSYRRKDTSETIKTIGIIVAGALSLMAIFVKVKK